MGERQDGARQQREEVEVALSRKDLEISDLERRLSECRDELERARRDTEKLTRWVEGLESGVSTILNSQRWRVGNLLGDLGLTVLRSGSQPVVTGSIYKLLGEFHEWERERGGEREAEGPGTSAPGEAVQPETVEVTAGSACASRQSGRRTGPREPGGIRKVQVGCGPHNLLDDWWNVDLRYFPGIDETIDATEPWPYGDLDYVFGEHFLEHLPLDGALEFLRHAGNSLRPDGRLRLSTPNLEHVLLTHYPYDDPGAMGRITGTLKTNRAFHGWGHQFLYSEEMLEYVLTEMGFEEVSFFSYGESEEPALQGLERHGSFSVYDGRPSVIIAEAKRGASLVSPPEDLASLLEREFLRYVASGH